MSATTGFLLFLPLALSVAFVAAVVVAVAAVVYDVADVVVVAASVVVVAADVASAVDVVVDTAVFCC